MPLCKKILTRLFRVFVHVYIHHFDRIVSIGAVSIVFIFILYILNYYNLCMYFKHSSLYFYNTLSIICQLFTHLFSNNNFLAVSLILSILNKKITYFLLVINYVNNMSLVSLHIINMYLITFLAIYC